MQDRAAWDVIAATASNLRLWKPPEPEVLRAASRRSGPFEHAMIALHDPAALGAELTARTRAWNTTHRHLPSPRHLDILLVMIVGGCILLTVPFWSDPAHFRWANLGIFASSGLSVLALRFMGRSLTVHQRFTRRACPDCGYDLRAIPDEFDPASLGARTGPRHCPECGGLWPLIPPPVTAPPASSPHPKSPPR